MSSSSTQKNQFTSLINLKSSTVSLSKTLISLPLLQQLCDALSKVDHITHIDLSHNQLGDAGVEILCDNLLIEKPQIKTLNLKSNGITDVGISFLVRALMRHGTLKVLNLGSNPISDIGLGDLGRMLSSSSSNNNNSSSNVMNHNSNNANAASINSNPLETKTSSTLLLANNKNNLTTVGFVELEEIDLMDTPISLHGTLTFADALVKNESLLTVKLPHVLGHRVLQEVDRLMKRNWMRKHRVDEKRATRATEDFHESMQNAKISSQWSSKQPKAKPAPPASGFTIEEWSDPELVPSLIYLEILDKKSKMVKKEEEKEMRKKNRRVTQTKSVLSSGGGGFISSISGSSNNNNNSTTTTMLKLPPILKKNTNKILDSGRRAW